MIKSVRTLLTRFTIIALALGSNLLFAGETPWQLVKSEENLNVYMNTQESDQHMLRLTGKVNASLTSLVAVLTNLEAMTSLSSNISEVKILKKVSDYENIIYQYMDIPFPLEDRDTIIHNKLEQNRENYKVQLVTKAMPKYLPPKEGVIRIPYSETTVYLTPLSATETEVEMIVTANFGGEIPEWMLKMLAINRTFHNIKALVEKANKPPFIHKEMPEILLPKSFSVAAKN